MKINKVFLRYNWLRCIINCLYKKGKSMRFFFSILIKNKFDGRKALGGGDVWRRRRESQVKRLPPRGLRGAIRRILRASSEYCGVFVGFGLKFKWGREIWEVAGGLLPTFALPNLCLLLRTYKSRKMRTD